MERALANAGRAALPPEQSTLDDGPPLSDADQVALLERELGAVILETWTEREDGTWVTDTGLVSYVRP